MLATRLAGLQVLHSPKLTAQPLLVFLHGFATLPQDFAEFSAIAAKSGTAFVFPRGRHNVAPHVLGRSQLTASWWRVNPEVRAAAMANGPRDLSDVFPQGVATARRALARLVHELRCRYRPSALWLGGFSQGAMLALDWQLHARYPADALVLMSAGQIRSPRWTPRLTRLHNVPVFQCHGRADADLCFNAAERLRDRMLSHGAQVTWLPLDAGHETPMVAWRGLNRFLSALPRGAPQAMRNEPAPGSDSLQAG